MTISQRIFGIMEKKHLKQSDLANYLGISNSSVSDWKKKGSVPSADKIVKISEFLNVSVDYLLGRTDEQNSTQQINTGNVGNHSQVNVNSATQLDDTTGELVTVFKGLKFSDKVKVMSLVAELSEKKGA
jgi:transcriptional regulator with XRE-family HTH domain